LVDLASPFRRATPADAAALADLVHFASEGLAFYLWSRMAGPGGDPWAVGRERAGRAVGAFSYRNAILVERDGRVAAGLIGYPLPDVPEPPPDNPPAMFVPLNELEDLVPGTWYVNVLAAYPERRGEGYGTALLGLAEELARETLRRGMSIIVADTNVGARRLYERCGYREVATRRMVKEGWVHPGTSFVLLTKSLRVQRAGSASQRPIPGL
jgi:ribosomal protein S18 acetylase RimI-like enzyme